MLSNSVLWSLQILLAVVFIGIGIMKLVRTREAIAASGGKWAMDVSARNVKLIGVVEILGGVGVIAPLYFGIVPVLTFFAAVGLALTMAAAAALHIKRGEIPLLIAAILTMAITLAVAYGRRDLLGG